MVIAGCKFWVVPVWSTGVGLILLGSFGALYGYSPHVPNMCYGYDGSLVYPGYTLTPKMFAKNPKIPLRSSFNFAFNCAARFATSCAR